MYNPSEGPKMTGIKIEDNIFGASERQIGGRAVAREIVLFRQESLVRKASSRVALLNGSFASNVIVGGTRYHGRIKILQ